MTKYAHPRLILLVLCWLLPAVTASQTRTAPSVDTSKSRFEAASTAPAASADLSGRASSSALGALDGGRMDANYWYFGELAGISFAGGTPAAVTDGQLNTLEGCAAASDPVTGRLLFYTDGATVWNGEHRTMENSSGLAGCFSSTQAALVLPDPAGSSRYYIFTTDCGSAQSFPGLTYSTVDMKRAGGLGSVVVKNVGLLPDSATEKLAGALHCNGRDYWVMTRVWGTDELRVYPVTSGGVGAPVVSRLGSVALRDPSNLDFHWRSGIGYLKVSPGGRRLAVANSFINYQAAADDYTESNVEVYDFDPATGRVGNRIEVFRKETGKLYGVSFSPDDSKLYISSWDAGEPIWQVDLSSGDPATIRGSVRNLPVPGFVQTGPLQLGPDGRIYVVYREQTHLGVIRQPNLPGSACDFAYDAIQLGGRKGKNGLPNFIDANIFRPAAEPPRVRVTERVSDETPRYDDTISYTITACNDGCSQTDLRVQNLLPPGLTYVDGFNAFPQHSFGPIPTGECRSVVLRVRVERSAPAGMPITSCAVLLRSDGTYREVLSSANCAAIVVHGSDVAVEQRVDRPRVRPAERVVYTLTVTNRGAGTVAGIAVRYPLPSGLHHLTHTLSVTGVYDPATGDLTIRSLEPDATARLEIACLAPEHDATIVTCAELAASDPADGDPTNDRACATIEVATPYADISLGQQIHPGKAYPGEEVTCSITVRNSGDLQASGLRLRAELPRGLTYLHHAAASPAGALQADFDPVTRTLMVPHLDTGGLFTFTIVCSVDHDARGTLETRAIVCGLEQRDRDRSNDTSVATLAVRVCAEPDVAVTGGIDGEHPVGVRYPASIPVMLDTPLDQERISRVRIRLRFDPARLAPMAGGLTGTLPSDGALAAGWRAASSLESGLLTLDLEAPEGAYLRGVGPLLYVPFRMYRGKESSPISAEIEFPGYSCIAAWTRAGSLRLDRAHDTGLHLLQPESATYALGDNTPNPFTSATTIGFLVGRDGPTSIVILDVTGRVVETLVDSDLSAGGYEVTWDGTAYAPGVYYCRMISGPWTGTLKMMRVK